MATLPLKGLKEAKPEPFEKTSKASVVYMDGDKGPFRCDHCEYFSKPNGCKIVNGYIDPAGCCNLYESIED